ncbi:coiled-coil domain-containing protein 57 [Tachyglossus aculeatus]|uniref:coiled-coil domain-containing protein 57 n=1 Tax=Tachyglossus aculeatus TaxID=9261 RepID=UPI0018F3E9DA|nr:coiled-coil domain-containing protein 57 [Tachyglossus aculeatus]
MLCPAQEAEVMPCPESGRRSPPGRLARLEEDFLYNLRLLEEQGRQLRHLEAALAGARGAEEARRAEASELKIQVAKLRQALAEEAGRRRDLRDDYRQRLREHRLELDRVHGRQSGEIDHHVEQYERLKRELERKVQELDGELALQKQELLAQFESELKKREHEFRLKADHVSNVVLNHQLKVKLLSKELEAAREAGSKAEESLRQAEATNLELEKEVKGKDWEMKTLAAVKDARIKHLEGKLHSVELTKKKEEERFQRKREELVCFSREKEAALSERVRELEAEVQRLQARGESRETEQLRARRRQADVLSRKDAAIAKLREEVAAVKSGWDAQIDQISKEIVSKDLRVQGLQEEEVKLKAHLITLQQDIDRYKRELSVALERERGLERAKIQAELDWQRRCETMERTQYQESEELIQALTAARDRVPDPRASPGPPPSAEVQRLREQNVSLRNVVARMREHMEALSVSQPSALAAGDRTVRLPPAPGEKEAATQTDAASTELAAEKLPAGDACLDSPPTQLRHKACRRPGLRGKLKEAARKICSLSREKQQLIDMGNRLRAELAAQAGSPTGAPRLPPHAALGTPKPSGPATARPSPAGSDPRLATQARPSSSTALCGSTLPPPPGIPAPEPDRTPSSGASGSFRDVWRPLELGSDPSPFTSQEDGGPGETPPPQTISRGTRERRQDPARSPSAFAIEATRVEVRPRPEAPRPPPQPRPKKAQSSRRIPRIRNYNVKD